MRRQHPLYLQAEKWYSDQPNVSGSRLPFAFVFHVLAFPFQKPFFSHFHKMTARNSNGGTLIVTVFFVTSPMVLAESYRKVHMVSSTYFRSANNGLNVSTIFRDVFITIKRRLYLIGAYP